MPKIQKIKVLSFAKFQAILASLLGLLAGVLYSFGGLLIDTLVSLGWITSTETPGLSFGTILAFGALVGMPALFASIGFLAGMISAVLYNAVERWFGGIKIDFNL
jgi:hypothetical protein